MTTKVRIIHGGGNKPLAIRDAEGTQVAVLEKEGDEFGDLIHSGKTQEFSVSEHVAEGDDAG